MSVSVVASPEFGPIFGLLARIGKHVRYRWLRVPDLNLHLDFQERMITADSLLRYQLNQALRLSFLLSDLCYLLQQTTISMVAHSSGSYT
jgi:hypothetical protein